MTLSERDSAFLDPNSKPVGEVRGVTLFSCSYTKFPRAEIAFPDNDYERERRHALTMKTKEGVKPMTPEEQEFERGVSKTLIKKLTMSIFSMDFTRFSFPVAYCEPRTFLERTADIFSFLAETYIDKAIGEKNLDHKLRFIAVGIMAGFQLHLQSKKPWNPIIGESFVARWTNGSVFYGEQTSHHPSVSNFQIYGPDKRWYCHSECKFGVSPGPMETQILQTGTFHLELSDGNVYEWNFPTISAIGMIRGDRIVRLVSPFIVQDLTNHKEFKVKFNPKKKKAKKYAGHCAFLGGIKDSGAKKKGIRIEGDYCLEIYSEGEKLWDIQENIANRPTAQISENEFLLSDSRYRVDRAVLILEDVDAADKAKVVLEEAQRKDAKLRTELEKKSKKKSQ